MPISLWTMSRDSVGKPWNGPVQLTDFTCVLAYWDPDGSRLACSTGLELVLVSREGAVLSSHDLSTAGLVRFEMPTFSADGSRIYFLGIQEDGSEGIWWIPAEGGDANEIITFDDPSLTVYSFAVGHENIYLAIATYESDIWVMDLDW